MDMEGKIKDKSKADLKQLQDQNAKGFNKNSKGLTDLKKHIDSVDKKHMDTEGKIKDKSKADLKQLQDQNAKASIKTPRD